LRTPEAKPTGKALTPRDSRRCFGCHSTQVAARGDQPIHEETMIPNVTCERCHGPARAHVEAARRGAPEAELGLPFGPDRWTPETLMTLCGTCHRHPSEAQPGRIRPDNPYLARVQPIGIMQSRCYRESGAFSCVACHDPHARASSDRPSYDRVCVSCHSHRESRSLPSTFSLADPIHFTGAPCPVSPRRGCVECHMSRVDSGQHVLFTDHWIRIRHTGESASGSRGSASSQDLFEPAEP